VHPFITAVIARLDEARSGLHQAVESVPSPLRSRRPADDRWSVNDVLEHLSLVEQLFTKRMVDALTTAREAGLGPEHAASYDPLPAEIDVMVVDRANKRTAPEPAVPRGLDNDAALKAVEASRAALLHVLTRADGLALSEVFTSHPRFGTLSLYQMTELIAGHEKRHTEQVREVAALLARL
jgi:hypothetical protein